MIRRNIFKFVISFFVIYINISQNIYCVSYELNISSKAGIVIESTTGRVLYGKNIREGLKIASLTKIMTAIVAVENADLDDMVKIEKDAAYIGGSTIGLKYNSEVKLESLLYGMLLKSGNDCAIAIAHHVGGTVENFVDMMNKKAYDIGAKDSYFTNPHGLDKENNHSTAYDMAVITRYAINNEYIKRIINTSSITLNFGGINKILSNTNRLLRTYPFCDGGKTGFTNRCK